MQGSPKACTSAANLTSAARRLREAGAEARGTGGGDGGGLRHKSGPNGHKERIDSRESVDTYLPEEKGQGLSLRLRGVHQRQN